MEVLAADCRTRPPPVETASRETPLLSASQNSQPGEAGALENDNRNYKALCWVCTDCGHIVHIQLFYESKDFLDVRMFHSELAFRKAPLPQCPANSKHCPAPKNE